MRLSTIATALIALVPACMAVPLESREYNNVCTGYATPPGTPIRWAAWPEGIPTWPEGSLVSIFRLKIGPVGTDLHTMIPD